MPRSSQNQAVVHGILLTKDDWALSAVSICHALINHVNVLHVLNHGSSDLTDDGLKLLKSVWGNRLQIYHVSSKVPFKQALLTNIIVFFAEQAGAEWVYVLDSDEFLLHGEENTLQKYLGFLDSSVASLKYQINNFISPFDFNRFDLNDYKRILYRARPELNALTKSPYEPMYRGEITFFDIPFPGKVIFRTGRKLWIKEGAHSIATIPEGMRETTLGTLGSAHLVLPDRAALMRKAGTGLEDIQRGTPEGHGWQGKLIFKLLQENRLEEFWKSHSIGFNNDLVQRHAKDESLAAALTESIIYLREVFGGSDMRSFARSAAKSDTFVKLEFDFESLVNLSEYLFERNMRSRPRVKLATYLRRLLQLRIY